MSLVSLADACVRFEPRRRLQMKHAAIGLLLALSAGLGLLPISSYASQPGPVFVPRGPNEPVVDLPVSYPAAMGRLNSNSAHIDPPTARITQPAAPKPPAPKPSPAIAK